MTRALSRRQRETLMILGVMLPSPHMWVRPGYARESLLMAEKRVGAYPGPGGLVEPAKALARRGLVTITGVAYGPKTYTLTDAGRTLAVELLREHEEQLDGN